MASEAQAYAKVCYNVVQDTVEEDPSVLKVLARHGEKIITINNKFFQEINGVVTDNVEWQSLAVPGKGNVSPLAPQNIGSGADAMFDALK